MYGMQTFEMHIKELMREGIVSAKSGAPPWASEPRADGLADGRVAPGAAQCETWWQSGRPGRVTLRPGAHVR